MLDQGKLLTSKTISLGIHQIHQQRTLAPVSRFVTRLNADVNDPTTGVLEGMGVTSQGP